MKIFSHNWLLLFPLIFGLPSLALAVPVSMAGNPMENLEKRLEYYEKIDGAKRCAANTGAGIDTQAGREYNSACRASYDGAKEAAVKYREAKEKATAELQKHTSQNSALCGANRTPAAQKTCFEGVASNYAKAAEIQKKLADDLIAAHNKAQKWRDQNAEALKKYREDLRGIEAVETEARNRANVLRSQGDTLSAALAVKQVQDASAVNNSGISVAARDGAASSITEYKGKFSALSQEQADSQDHATKFADAARSEASKLMQQSVDYQEMAEQARAQAKAITTTGTDESGSGISGKDQSRVPVPGDGKAARAEYQAGKGTGGGDGTGGNGQKGISGTNQAPPAGEATADTNNSNASQTPGATPAAASAMPAAAAAAPAASSVAQPAGSSGDPFAGMNNSAAYNNNGGQTAQNNPKSTNFGEVLGTYDPRNKEDPQTAEADAEAKTVESSPGQAAAAGGLSGGVGEDNSGASSSPGIRGADGKPIRTGFSSAGGGSIQSSRQNMDKDATSGGGFSPDLKSGAVSIAGSEMKSAMQSLAQELGATDLDLNLGDLTAEEKAALAPLEGGDGVRNFAPIANGRRTASVIQGSDASIQDEQSAALFSRTRSAHERALKRGNLILGTRKKL